MLKESEKWILPENLKKQEEEDMKHVDEGTFDGRGDFGSYYGLLAGQNINWVKSHAVMDDRSALNYIKQVRGILLDCDIIPKNLDILDIGCGPGTITNAFHSLLENCSVTGIDISRHSIEYAQKTYPNCVFIQRGVDCQTNLPQKYNIIHSREFYPFTRTSDIETHLAYIKMFSKHLHKNGIIIIYFFAPSLETFADTYSKIDGKLSEMQLTPIIRSPRANVKISHFVSLPISIKLTQIIYRCLNKKPAYFYITRKT
ncbi:MAG TPA: class I SAM-dependent methyltransferase [bacterium]|nr:class I SAM-dependent methyltransferase [bacterium]